MKWWRRRKQEREPDIEVTFPFARAVLNLLSQEWVEQDAVKEIRNRMAQKDVDITGWHARYQWDIPETSDSPADDVFVLRIRLWEPRA